MKKYLIATLAVFAVAISSAQTTSVFEAARTGDLKTLEQLTIDPAAANTRGPNGRTPLHEAAAGCQIASVKFLVDHWASREATDGAGAKSIDLIENCPIAIRVSLSLMLNPGTEQKAPWSLHYAITHHQTQVVSMLVSLGTNVNEPGPEGNRPLNISCLDGNAPITKLLLEHGADPNLRSQSGATALHDAALGGSAEVIDLLLQHNADIRATDREDGSTPLHIAAAFDRLEAVKTLVQHGADVHSKNAKGLTPLDLAVKSHFIDVQEFLGRSESPR
jgi:ankyrin repeat protein